MRRYLPALVLCVVVSCDNPTAPLPPGAVRFDVPDVYEQWWALTEQCSGLTGDVRSVEWYVVPGASSVPGPGGRSFHGVWSPRPSRVVLAGDSQFSGDLVRHEMLHALMNRGGHSREAFLGKCSGVVVCTGSCLTEAGAPPPADALAIHAPPSQLQITVEVTPSTPSSTQYGGNFMMTVSASNETGKALLIDLPDSGDDGPPVSFSFRLVTALSQPWYYMRAEAPEAARFAVGETKRFIFDFRNQPGSTRYDVAPGTYRFEGGYGDVWATNPPTVTVHP